MTDRRDFLTLCRPSAVAQTQPAATRNADSTIEIASGLAEIGPDQIISTTLYNGQFPGPSNTDHSEFLHWHGQKVSTEVDGAAEEGSRAVPPNGMIRRQAGQRVLFHVLNGSAGEIRNLAMARHRFRVIALDSRHRSATVDVPVLWIGTAERISAVVEMNHPGVFVLGDLADDDRGHGMGIVVEYAGAHGKPQWQKPRAIKWTCS